MKLCYALRRGVYFPSRRDVFGEMPPHEHRARYLVIVHAAGFEGVELPDSLAIEMAEREAKNLSAELCDAGLPAIGVRSVAAVAHPREGPAARERLRTVVRFACWVGARVVNVTLFTPATQPGGPGAQRTGEPTSQGASRTASEADFIETAKHMRDIGLIAADEGIELSVEIHHGSIADNSWSGCHLLELIGLPNVGVNPDLSNILTQYEEPEETCEAAIVALAPKTNYWHCKNVKRVYIPELHRAIFLRAPLDEGGVDYRFAISTMIDAGYQGYLAIEGTQEGDQLTQDIRSATYVRRLLNELG